MAKNRDMWRVFLIDEDGVECDTDYEANSAEQAEALARIDYPEARILTDRTTCVLKAF